MWELLQNFDPFGVKLPIFDPLAEIVIGNSNGILWETTRKKTILDRLMPDMSHTSGDYFCPF